MMDEVMHPKWKIINEELNTLELQRESSIQSFSRSLDLDSILVRTGGKSRSDSKDWATVSSASRNWRLSAESASLMTVFAISRQSVGFWLTSELAVE
ncbi:hypothetical protein QYF36_022203 [Acer negundo]|nr:hypothetical protein QYF36_022203 [Acer negundo]